MKLRITIICSILLLFTIIGVLAYSTYGAPSEFGNETTTTCYVGGDEGIVNCTGNIIGNYFSGNGSQLTGIIHTVDTQKTTSGSYVYNDSAIIYSNDTKLNDDFNQTQTILDNNASWSTTFNSTYDAKADYQFINNNFNGTGNFTTTGIGTFNSLNATGNIYSNSYQVLSYQRTVNVKNVTMTAVI